MSTSDESIKSWKSLPQREAMMKICDSITQTNDLIGQVVRTHLWVEGFINLILYQKSEFCQNKPFASKRKRLFELGLIDETHNQELKIFNQIRNRICHQLYPHKYMVEAVKKFPTYDQFKIPQKLEVFGLDVSDMGTFGLISFMLMHYLMTIFWDPKIKN